MARFYVEEASGEGFRVVDRLGKLNRVALELAAPAAARQVAQALNALDEAWAQKFESLAQRIDAHGDRITAAVEKSNLVLATLEEIRAMLPQQVREGAAAESETSS